MFKVGSFTRNAAQYIVQTHKIPLKYFSWNCACCQRTFFFFKITLVFSNIRDALKNVLWL